MSAYLNIAGAAFEAVNYNNDFLLLKPTEPLLSIAKYTKAIYNAQLDFITEVIGTEVEICLKLNDKFTVGSLSAIESLTPDSAQQTFQFKCPIYFDIRMDWQEITAHTGLSKLAYLNTLLDTKFFLSMHGFLPGFLYLRGLPKELQVPRKTVPSTAVKAGTFAVGGPYLGYYNLQSPGGWHQIGSCPLIMTNSKLPFTDLEVGDTIQLIEITEQDYKVIREKAFTLKAYNEVL